MALQQDEKTIKRIKDSARKARQRKLIDQSKSAKGIDFPAYGPGVIPERIRAQIKKGVAS